MKKALTLIMAFFPTMFIMSCIELAAQNAVLNPQFSTMDLQHWNGTDPSMHVATGPQFLGMESVCLHKSPGHPNDNGSI